jgi:integrase
VAAGERPHSTRNAPPDRVKALSPAQVRAQLDAGRGTRNEALYVLAVHTGLRQGELLGLKWSDLDDGKVSVRRALKITEHGLGFGSTKNKASRRSVTLNQTAADALRAHRTRQNAERLEAPEWFDGPYETCGGRSLNDDSMATLYTLLINAGKGPRVSDGVHQATKPPSDVFPYLAPPNPPLTAQQAAALAAAFGQPTEAPKGGRP